MPSVAQAQRSFDNAKAKVAKLQEQMKAAREDVAQKRQILANAKAEARMAEAQKKKAGTKPKAAASAEGGARPMGKRTVSKKISVKQAIAAKVGKK